VKGQHIGVGVYMHNLMAGVVGPTHNLSALDKIRIVAKFKKKY